MHLGTKLATKRLGWEGGYREGTAVCTLSEFKNSSHFVTAFCPHVNIPRMSEGAEKPLEIRFG